MKKLLVTLFLVLGALLLLAPAVAGVIIRSADADMLLAPLAAQTGAQVTQRSVSGGWFSSHMVFEVTHPGLNDVFPASSHYRLKLGIRHGPILLTRHGLETGLAYADLDPEFSGPVAQLGGAITQATQQDLNASLLAGFADRWRMDVSASQITLGTDTDRVTLHDLSSTLHLQRQQDPAAGRSRDLHWALTIPRIESNTDLDAVQWQISIQGLQDEFISLYTGLIGNTADTPAAQALAAQIGDRASLLLLQQPLTADAQVQIEAFGGDHRGNLAILWPGLPALSSLEQFRLADVIRDLNIEIGLVADEAALRRSPGAEALAAYEMQRLVRVSQGQVEAEISLTDGTLNINGQLLPLEPFLNL